jgi:hypothetical protein
MALGLLVAPITMTFPVLPKKPINQDDLLTLVLGIGGPGNCDRVPFSAHIYDVAGRYGEFLRGLIIDAGFTMPNISLLSISYLQLYLSDHHYSFNSLIVMRRQGPGEDERLVLQMFPTLCFIRPISSQRSGSGLLISGANPQLIRLPLELTLTISSTKAS